MFTGIVQDMLPITALSKKPGLTTFAIDLTPSLLSELETGASIAVNGVCFTVTEIKAKRVFFDAIAETMDLSNIGDLAVGTQVNIERSAKAGVEIGGHILSGHVIGRASVTDIERSENNRRMTFQGSKEWMKYIFNKGFLALNGASLTVASVDRTSARFSINLIPETLRRTNFSLLEVGETVNVEIDQQTQVIVDTVTNLLDDRLKEGILEVAR